MTPEREAQMRGLFEKWKRAYAVNTAFALGESPSKDEIAKAAWDACARALEPKLKDAERYQWLRNEANNTHAWAPMTFNCNPNWQIGWSDALHGEHLDTAIDSAMSAALEDGNERNSSE